MTDAFLFDTYAIIEILSSNNQYSKYIGSSVVINDFIYSELVYHILKLGDLQIMKPLLDEYSSFRVAISKNTIIEAMKFRYKNKKQKMSITDCISYKQAESLGIPFLTGDKEFKGMKNVEFVQ